MDQMGTMRRDVPIKGGAHLWHVDVINAHGAQPVGSVAQIS